jgi:SulP family sulfate permease
MGAARHALWHALSPGPILALWRMNRDRLLIVAAAVAVLCFGVLDGLLAAIALSVLVALQRFSQPVVHELGALGSSRNFVDVVTQEGAAALPGILILRPEEPLFFGSAERVMNEVQDRVAARANVHTVVLSLEESADLDSTAVECLMELNQVLQRDGKRLVLARTKTTLRELLGRWDPQGLGKPERLFWSVADAVQYVTHLNPSPVV